MLEAFQRLHTKRFSYADKAKPVEVVNLRVQFTATTEPVGLPFHEPCEGDAERAVVRLRPIFFAGEWSASKVYDREKLTPGDRFSGPALVTEYSATTVLSPGCAASVDGFGNLVIDVAAEAMHD